MRLTDALGASWRRLQARWLESGLIVMAVALGVGVLAVVAAVLGVRVREQADFDASLAARQGVVKSLQGNYDAFGRVGGELVVVRQVGSIYTPAPRFSFSDLVELKAAAPSVDYVYVRGFRTFNSEAWDGALPAASFSADYLAAARIEVIEGSLPGGSDFQQERRVIVLTKRFASLLGVEDPIVGRTIEFVGEDAPYTIVGVLPPVGDGQPMTVREALVPFRAGQDAVTEIYFAVDDSNRLAQAVAEVETYARSRWEDGASVATDRVQSLQYMREQSARGLAVAFFATAALVLAACNVLALMLARVTQREREIGIVRSFGATKWSVSGGVMLDSALVGAVGGVLGMLLGRALLGAYNARLASGLGGIKIEFSYSLTGALIAAACAMVLAMLAGLYPAVLATRTRIVDALRGV